MTYKREDAILQLAAHDGTRLAMRGESMRPLLREGMVLEVRAYDGAVRTGDVVIFRQKERLVAHRVVKISPSGVTTSGDGQPRIVEDVQHGEILAVVDGVRSDDTPDARQIDGRFFALCGRLYAYAHPLRAQIARLRAFIAASARFALPRQRQRIQPRLVSVLAALVQADDQAFEAALAGTDPERLVQAALRHRVAATLTEGLRRLGDEPATKSLRSRLTPFVRYDAVQTFFQRRRILEVAEVLHAADVPFALLKGAARIFRADAITIHPSVDIDLFVPRAAVDAAVAALRRAGYGFRADVVLQFRYATRHHHIAPLYPASPGPTIEIHTELAPPGTLGTRSEWEKLEAHLVEVETAEGKARCFDAWGTAFHYAIHGIGLTRLRDLVFCAEALRELDEPGRAELRRLAATDSIDPTRFSASLVMAARIAGLGWPSDPEIERYLDWTARRDDMPRALRARSWGVEAWFVAGRRARLDRRALTLDNPRPYQVAGRIALVPFALAYAAAMRA